MNFDIPSNHEDYVHRIGRTARANNTGTAITLVNPAEEYNLRKIEDLIRMKIPQLELPADLDLVVTKKEEKSGSVARNRPSETGSRSNLSGSFPREKILTWAGKEKRKKKTAKRQGEGKTVQKRRQIPLIFEYWQYYRVFKSTTTRHKFMQI